MTGSVQQRGDDGAGRSTDDGAGQSSDALGVADLLRANLSDRNSLLDSTLPTLAFLTGYLLSGSRLSTALIAAVAAGVFIAVMRAVRRESLRHIAAGFLGVAIAAWLANRTGAAEDFFLPGLLLNLGYAAAFACSALVRRPLVGVGISVMTADGGAWRDFGPLRSAAYRATWVWSGLFTLRVVVQLPLYFAGAVGALGVAKLVLGFPVFLLGALATHRLLSPALALRRGSDSSPALSGQQTESEAQRGGPTERTSSHESHPHRDPLA